MLDEQVKRVAEAGGDISGAHAKVGRPDAEIVRLAEELGAGLIVLGSRGLGGVRRALMGSVSDSVVRHAHTSVLVVRGGDGEEDRPPGSIVLALDGSEEATFAARVAAKLSASTGAGVRVISVMPTPAQMFGPHLYSEEMKQGLLEQAEGDARRFLDKQAERIESEGGSVAGTYLGTGRPDEEIVELAEEVDAGMIVTGNRGLGGVRRVLLGRRLRQRGPSRPLPGTGGEVGQRRDAHVNPSPRTSTPPARARRPRARTS
jgi:nucleotide-binding universal stress UspA family protein